MEPLKIASPSQKKIVRYHQLRACKVGSQAIVWPIDHPEIPVGQFGKTSTIQMFDPVTGVAETANTRYEPSPFAEWAERRDETHAGRTYRASSIIPLR
ncbi:hypothetical protein [Rhodoferax sp.]|uniref:hypothetical protein n=1 Tax=Rhodoferax sp. TaxID=50421 RepID=UPI002847E8D2|nr:hypothetical protein [Rhodoferax sp.]MDR3369578.1 hypothetical protein [Rhodoferax sp.]